MTSTEKLLASERRGGGGGGRRLLIGQPKDVVKHKPAVVWGSGNWPFSVT